MSTFFRLCIYLTGYSIVHQFDLTLVCQQNIAPFNISVETFVLLEVDQGVEDILNNVGNLVLVQTTTFSDQSRTQIRDRPAATELHRKPDIGPTPEPGVVGNSKAGLGRTNLNAP